MEVKPLNRSRSNSLNIKDETPENSSTNNSNPIVYSINKEYDESIYFQHHFDFYRKLEVVDPSTNITNPFLMSTEYSYSYFEEKISNKEADKESIAQILGHIKLFTNSHDEKFIRNFLENIKTYAEMIGIESTSNNLVPALAKIVDEQFPIKLQFLKVLLPFIDYLCSNGDEGIKLLKNNILNIIEELYHPTKKKTSMTYSIYEKEKFQNLLFKNFIKIAKAILPTDKEQKILNMIISFGYEETNPKIWQ